MSNFSAVSWRIWPFAHRSSIVLSMRALQYREKNFSNWAEFRWICSSHDQTKMTLSESMNMSSNWSCSSTIQCHPLQQHSIPTLFHLANASQKSEITKWIPRLKNKEEDTRQCPLGCINGSRLGRKLQYAHHSVLDRSVDNCLINQNDLPSLVTLISFIEMADISLDGNNEETSEMTVFFVGPLIGAEFLLGDVEI